MLLWCQNIDDSVINHLLSTTFNQHLMWSSPRFSLSSWYSSVEKSSGKTSSLFEAYKRSDSSSNSSSSETGLSPRSERKNSSSLSELQAVDVKTFWKLFNLLTRKEYSISTIPNSALVVSKVQKADILYSQFFSNFNHSVPSLTSRILEIRAISELLTHLTFPRNSCV